MTLNILNKLSKLTFDFFICIFTFCLGVTWQTNLVHDQNLYMVTGPVDQWVKY